MRSRSALLVMTALFGFVESCSTSRHGEQVESTPVLTGYPVDSRPVTPDSTTALRLWALAGAARELKSASGKLPESMEELLRLRRQTVHVSPQAEWAVDGWGRPIMFSLHDNRQMLLLLSCGPDGNVGGGDDLFEVVRAQ